MYHVNGIEFYPANGGGEAFLALPGHVAASSEFLADIDMMQATGFFDARGNEVYEGDVLLAKSWCGGRKFTTPDGPAKLEIIYTDGSFKAKRVGRLQQFALSFLDEPEIIGNIYENPELLA